MIRNLVSLAALALIACSDASGPVDVTPTDQQTIRIENRTAATIYYTAFDANALALINWGPCNNPDTCSHVEPGRSDLMPYTEIGFYSTETRTAVVYWWHLRRSANGSFVADSIRAVPVTL